MSLPKMLLVPTDFGAPSEAALDYAFDLAKATGGEIVLMHAYEIPIVGFPDGAIVTTADLDSRIVEGSQTALERQVESRRGRGVRINSVLKQGDAYRMVNEAAEEVGADLIVMGTHGRKGLPRALIGSVAEKVVRTSKVPVLTVHPQDRPEAASRAGTRPPANGPGAPEPRPRPR